MRRRRRQSTRFQHFRMPFLRCTRPTRLNYCVDSRDHGKMPCPARAWRLVCVSVAPVAADAMRPPQSPPSTARVHVQTFVGYTAKYARARPMGWLERSGSGHEQCVAARACSRCAFDAGPRPPDRLSTRWCPCGLLYLPVSTRSAEGNMTNLVCVLREARIPPSRAAAACTSPPVQQATGEP